MIDIDIPGHRYLSLEYLVLDYNGTLAIDGEVIPGGKNALRSLATRLTIHIVTADIPRKGLRAPPESAL